MGSVDTLLSSYFTISLGFSNKKKYLYLFYKNRV